ncbi:polyketide synthase-1 [Paramyrothecium foliicola]|nr:polyketide synthase-1 [Paramyrothecium foliicola]
MVEPIAVIGSGCRFPGGADTPSKLWALIHHPHDLSRKPSRFNIDPFYHPVGTHHGTTNAAKSYWLEDSGRSNVAQFDAGFFNIQPAEVEAMDPQQRLLLEVVYDGLCAAGQPMEKLRGTDTAVYVGMMCDDYNTMLARDWESLPRYAATGLERAVTSNRVSYFFDWHGPSMTVDTACSSSMVALDQAVQVLRSGKSKVAVAAGTSLILSPAMYISESNLGMLSPTGRCAMWDVEADGYTRGEGVAAVILKTLSQALADNDPIECIIRDTAVNQDGRTPGLTMPSSAAQASLIRECYARAGLDPIKRLEDRPQFFHAHGTGTQAGDPQEAEAISTALFPEGSGIASESDKLLVGSVKTVIGHTEGTAGLASLISTSMALRHKIVPPNLHFQTLNPKVAPFFTHLDIPTSPTPWAVREGHVRRASVNSFGFGGTNAHCILEEVLPELKGTITAVDKSSTLFTPLVFSAASEAALRATLDQYLNYLTANPTVDIASLAYTLQHRRSALPYRKTVVATTVQDAIQSLSTLVGSAPDAKEAADIGTRFTTLSKPARILGVFTGQGAQWPRMGAELIEKSPFAARRVQELDAALQSLTHERPSWSLRDQLLAGKETSRIAEAALSQPLCTAVQILLVDILREAGVIFKGVVGHSSGEIGAAYAAGLVSAQDAIRIAYFRGVHAKLAASPNAHGPRGAMMAVGISAVEANTFCKKRFAGRMQLAAVNSGSTVTLSGDEDAVDEAEQIFKSQGTFARKLKVDTAYHSAHMGPCASPYLSSLENNQIRPIQSDDDATTVWYSSVFEGESMSSELLTNQYWVDNMCSPVLFAGALENAVQKAGPFDMAIEVGPHPALKGPATSTTGSDLPYTGLLSRGQSDVQSLSIALGFVWTRIGFNSVQFSAVQTLLSGICSERVIQDLPAYPFEHQRTYWAGSRVSNHFKHRRAIDTPNPVLGSPCSEATTPGEFQWRNMLRPDDMVWLKGHMLQGQTVFPATGYVSMAVEATKALAADASISVFEVIRMEIPRAIAFDHDGASVETIFSVSSVDSSEPGLISAEWACYSVSDGGDNLVLNARGHVAGRLASAAADALPGELSDSFNLVDVKEDTFYNNLSKIGYGYLPPFQGLRDIRRKPGYSTGTLLDESGSSWENSLIVHPGMLDSALQTIFAAWSYPGDTQLPSLHVPISIDAITVNAYFTPLGDGGKQERLQYETSLRSRSPAKVTGDVFLHTRDGNAFVSLEGIALVPFSPASPKNDIPMFSHFQRKIASPDGELAAAGERLSDYEVQLYKDADRVSFWYARNAALSIPLQERHGLLPHFQHYLGWCDRMVEMVTNGALTKVVPACNNDSHEDIEQVMARYHDRKDMQFVQVVGENLVPVIRAGNSMLEHMNQDGLLRAFYEENALCGGPSNRWLSRLVSQISHRFPALNIFEIGAGTGATTASVLNALDGAYSSYTFTDISSGFFMAAEERFQEHSTRMAFKTFNMEKDPSDQGFSPGTYDVVVAVNVLHVSADMEASLSNIRRLLKPGGYLLVGELTSIDLLFTGMTVGTLPGWWIGAETGRPWGPLLDLDQWDTLLKNTGFAGLDTVTPDISDSLPMSVFVSQAVNGQVTLLRSPLAAKERPAGVRNDGLAIIGGLNSSVHKLSRQVHDILDHRFLNKQFFDTVQDFTTSPMPQSATTSGPITILCLTDLDKPYLEDLTPEKFGALKVLFATAGTMIWVTRGSRDESPYSYMMTGILHTVKTENPSLNIQIYDLDSEAPSSGIESRTATDLADGLLRQHLLHSWGLGSNTDALLWLNEPEIFISQGRQLITRLVPDHEKNARYNSQRREVWAQANPFQDSLALIGSGNGRDGTFELQKVTPLRAAPNLNRSTRTIQITQSSLKSIAVSGAGLLRLFVGLDNHTGETLLAMTGSSESPAVVPAAWCFPVPEAPAPHTLVSVAAHLIAEYLLLLSPPGSTLLVQEPDVALESALLVQASYKKVTPIFVTSSLPNRRTGSSIFLHPKFSRHTTRSAVPKNTAVFVSFSRSTESDLVREAVIDCLAPGCLRIGEDAVLSNTVLSYPQSDSMNLVPRLETAWKRATHGPLEKHISTKSLPLTRLSDHTSLEESIAVVDWTAVETVTAKLQPIDHGTLFRPDRTYFFAGMAGELGQSLAEWLIEHGARFVVLSSRSPKVHPKFIAEMKAKYGAVVQAISLDVTSRDSLQLARAVIGAAMPPIAGVLNGAMILDDDLFANMTYKQFTRVTRPKVVGTQLLDELFYDDPSLDFFIVASSIASVIGFSGQSNYSAANQFMTGLVHQRRKRGVVGSTMSIPGVLGLGYAANQANFDFDYFQSIGYINISEQDLHVLFAEAVLSGRVGSGPKGEVAMGVNYIPADLAVKDAHKRDAKFRHFIRNDADRAATGGSQPGSQSQIPVKVLLQEAKNWDAAYSVTRDAFLQHLSRMLRLGEDSNLEEKVPLIEQGVDSLVAVDIRAWFLKELAVDVPTLKVLGGGSIADLVKAALDKMPDVAQSEAASAVPEPAERVVVPAEVKAGSAPASSPPSRGRSPVFSPTLSDGPDSGAATSPTRFWAVGNAYDGEGNLRFATGGFVNAGKPLINSTDLGYADPSGKVHKIMIPISRVENNFAISGTDIYFLVGPAGAADTVNATGYFYGLNPSKDGVRISSCSIIPQMPYSQNNTKSVCSMLLCNSGARDNENSFVAHWDVDSTYHVVVANSYNAPPLYIVDDNAVFGDGTLNSETINGSFNDISQMAPGLFRVDFNDRTGECVTKWTNSNIRISVSPVLSTKTGLLYTPMHDNDLAPEGTTSTTSLPSTSRPNLEGQDRRRSFFQSQLLQVNDDA